MLLAQNLFLLVKRERVKLNDTSSSNEPTKSCTYLQKERGLCRWYYTSVSWVQNFCVLNGELEYIHENGVIENARGRSVGVVAAN